MRLRMRMGLAMVVALAGGVVASAQQSLEPAQSTEQSQPPAPPQPSPAPGEEVMRPTQRGLRLTPTMARTFGQMAAKGMANQKKELKLTEDQQRRFADSTARRIMEVWQREGQEAGPAVEFIIESALTTGFKVNAENCREYGEKLAPLARMFSQIVETTQEDARSILDEQQIKLMEPPFIKARELTDRFEQRLKDYREGKAADVENPFDALTEGEKSEQPKEDDRVQQARQKADWEMGRVTGWEWNKFLTGAEKMFGFDDAQKAKGEAVLAEYRKKAEAIQTPEWKAKVRRNRTLAELQDHLEKVPRGPWAYRLDQEYEEANRPLVELGGEFRKAVLALVTPQQRDAMFEKVRDGFGKHGVEMQEGDVQLLLGLLQ